MPFSIRQLVPNQSVDCLMLKRLPIPPHINSQHTPTNADTRTRTLITFLLVREISNLL
nr:MAG TPA: hypothetical protein [Bacteriophage sp.]